MSTPVQRASHEALQCCHGGLSCSETTGTAGKDSGGALSLEEPFILLRLFRYDKQRHRIHD
ncbi:hypothetical protein [Carnimonas bestiolae]|uniref:hypothetical protein n=1 Tax=Carnimonas bestiolae TaxID=3402172 RepID=UPI003F4AC114